MTVILFFQGRVMDTHGKNVMRVDDVIKIVDDDGQVVLTRKDGTVIADRRDLSHYQVI